VPSQAIVLAQLEAHPLPRRKRCASLRRRRNPVKKVKAGLHGTARMRFLQGKLWRWGWIVVKVIIWRCDHSEHFELFAILVENG